MNYSLITTSNAHRHSSKQREGLLNIYCVNTSFTVLWSQFASLEKPLKRMDFHEKKRIAFHISWTCQKLKRPCEEPATSAIAWLHVAEDSQVPLSHLSNTCLPDGVKIAANVVINTQGSLKDWDYIVFFFSFVCGHHALLAHVIFNHSIFFFASKKMLS